MFNTFNYIFLLYLVECLLDHCFVRFAQHAHELLGPELPEVVLDLAEYKFDGIVFRAIWHIVYEPEAVVPHGLLRPVRSVRRKIIHEEADFLALIGLPELVQELQEPVDVHRELEDLEKLQPLILRDAS